MSTLNERHTLINIINFMVLKVLHKHYLMME